MQRICLLWSLLLLSNIVRAQQFDTFSVRYAIGSYAIGTAQQAVIENILPQIQEDKILIYSYADYLGAEKPNDQLAENRAQTLKQYLLKKGIKEQQIMECTGLGQVKGSGNAQGDSASRRTDIFVIRRDKKPLAPTIQPVLMAEKPILKKVDTHSTITPIPLQQLEKNNTIVLKHLLYTNGSDVTLKSSKPELDNLLAVMKENAKLRICIEGHVCCCEYPDGYLPNTPTFLLSVDRAKRVYQYLISNGIDKQRLEYRGYGHTKPLFKTESNLEEERANRRVEIRILEKE
jgi:outer membrane protein OmpA-like peptidoglycan-associated protein